VIRRLFKTPARLLWPTLAWSSRLSVRLFPAAHLAYKGLPPMAEHPTECPVCNSVAFAVQKERRNYQHETHVHTASFESHHASTTFHVRCNKCGNQWVYLVPADLEATR
jgi:hypothetical protein